jgi:molybdopterin synthase sulfur carrier subunit
MVSVWIPALVRDLTGGRAQASAPGRTVGEIVAALDEMYPGIRERLCQGDQLSPAVIVWVDGRVARLGLLEPVGEESEVLFLPAVAGG